MRHNLSNIHLQNANLLAGVTGSKSRELNGLGEEKFSNGLLHYYCQSRRDGKTALQGWCIRRCACMPSAQSLLRSCLPVSRRKSSERWRGFITSVANRNLRAMSFYRKEEGNVTFAVFARLVRLSIPFSLFHLFDPSSSSSSSRHSRVLFLSSVLFFLSHRPAFLSSIVFSISGNANRAMFFADNFAERKSHRVRLLSEPPILENQQYSADSYVGSMTKRERVVTILSFFYRFHYAE